MSEEVKQEITSTEDLLPLPGPAKITVTVKEKEDFFKAMLSDKPYFHVAKLFDGKIKVRFKTLTVDENTDILNQINMDQDKGVAKNTNAYFTKIAQYRLGLSIDQISDNPFQPSISRASVVVDDTAGTSYVTERAKIFDTWHTPKLAGFLSSFREFENKVLHMTNMMEDPTFWKAAV